MPHQLAQRHIHIFAILAALLLATGLAGRGAHAHGEGEVHECGNGVQEGHEQCDDGNLIDDDGCSNLCTCEVGQDTTTFQALQRVVFDGYQCSNPACHNSLASGGPQGGLDLTPAAAYQNLLGADGLGAASFGSITFKRVLPAEPEASFLYLKLLAKTDPARLAEIHPGLFVGTPMPSLLPPLAPEHLEGLRRWIRFGAPEEGAVPETAELLGTCLPPPGPGKLPVPNPPPVVDGDYTGFQIQQNPWTLGHLSETFQGEKEICMATLYDATDLVPNEEQFDCPSFFAYSEGERNVLNPLNKCFRWHKQTLYQDPQSHHSIIHIYTGRFDWDAPPPDGRPTRQWGPWVYRLEPDDPDFATQNGQPCNPSLVESDLGYHPGCSGQVFSTVACNGYGPDDVGQFGIVAGGTLPQFSGSQEPRYEIEFADGVFATLPVRAIVVWNSHAFNLTEVDTTMAQYLNLEFARPEDQRFSAQGIFAAEWIFAQNVPPFQTQEICATRVLPRGAQLFQLSSHTHQRGVQWRLWEPPNIQCQPRCPETACLPSFGICLCENRGVCSNDRELPCTAGQDCGAEATCEFLPYCDDLGYPRQDEPLYFSTEYSDPLQLNLDPPISHDSPDVEDRTYLYCSLYDNGSGEDSPPVKRQSTSPVPPPLIFNDILIPPEFIGDLIGGPCPDTTVACLGGPNEGMLCGGSDAVCGAGGICDACPVHGGVTTGDEMFILLGTYHLPEPPLFLLRACALASLALLAQRRRKLPQSGTAR